MNATAVSTCRAEWGLLPAASEYRGAGLLTNVRTGRHISFDRIVFDVEGRPSWSLVRYVKNVVTMGLGEVVPLRGDATLEIILSVLSHRAYDPGNHNELTAVHRYRTFRQVADAGSLEGQTTIALGVRAHLPFRVFTLTGRGATSSVVVDVAHAW